MVCFSFKSKLILFLVVFHFDFSHAEQSRIFIRHPYQELPVSTFIKVFQVNRHLDCAFACNRNSRCKSFNFGAVEDNTGEFICQLIPVDMGENSLTASNMLHHYEMFLLDPCSSSPCQNGGKCTVAIATRDVACTCSLGFSGNRCQKMSWVKFNSNPTCFGAKNDHFGTFSINDTGSLVSMRLVQVNGELNCDVANPKGWNHWGCLDNNGNYQFMSVIITDNTNTLKFPGRRKLMSIHSHVWRSEGVNANSKELVFPKPMSALPVVSGEQYRIWFGQDLDNQSDTDNGGKVCVDVYGLYL